MPNFWRTFCTGEGGTIGLKELLLNALYWPGVISTVFGRNLSSLVASTLIICFDHFTRRLCGRIRNGAVL